MGDDLLTEMRHSRFAVSILFVFVYKHMLLLSLSTYEIL